MRMKALAVLLKDKRSCDRGILVINSTDKMPKTCTYFFFFRNRLMIKENSTPITG